MTLSCLLLQKPSRNSKAKDHSKMLQDRLKVWNEGKIDMLVKEAKTIQNCFRNSTNTKRTQDNGARSFAKLMCKGKTQAPLKMLSKDYENGVLKIDDDILTEIKSKHPPAAEVKQDSLLFGPINELSHCYFYEIDKIMTAKATSLTKGAGGPSHLDADQFRHMLLSKKFKTEAKELRQQIAVLARTLASTSVDPKSVKPLTTCRLILLNKNSGVRPIGVGEVLRQNIGKVFN